MEQNEELISYIKKRKESGASREDIKDSLIQAGWKKEEVDEGFEGIFSTTKLLNASELLKESFKAYKEKFWVLVQIIIFPVALAAFFDQGLIILENQVNFFILGILTLISPLVSYFFSFWSQLALIYAIKSDLDFVQAFKESWKNLAAYFWLVALVYMVTTGGFILFVIPGFIFSIWFSFASFILANEDIKGVDALLKSKFYIQSKGLLTLWKIIFICLLFILIATPIYVALAFILAFAGFDQPTIEMALKFVISAFAPFITVYLFSYYKNLKGLKENVEFKDKGKKWPIVIGIIGMVVLLIISILLIINYIPGFRIY